MDLHAEYEATDTLSAHAQRGFARYMQLHKKHCTKRTSEMGVALRAMHLLLLAVDLKKLLF